MPKMPHMHQSLARLLRLARQATASNPRPVQTLPQLRDMLGVTPQVINAWKTRGVSKQGAISASRLIGCSVSAILDDGADNWMNPHHPLGGAETRGSVAQEVSLQPYIVAPMIQWEQIMKAKQLPGEFETVLVDDAMAPTAPKGTKVRFTTRREPLPGDAVLLSDQTGTLYFREYHASLQGDWLAKPVNAFYPTLNSSEHGLRVLAVFVGIESAWAQLNRQQR